MKDLMAAVSRVKKEANNDESDGNNLSLMKVRTLMMMLNCKGLEIDGSREVMIARLREQSSE